jgi:AcrR family transcriptional regulator
MRQRGQTRNKIIEAALQPFVRQGYHGTSINDITQKGRITKAGFCSHFDSKGQLLLRITNEYESQYIDQLIRIVTEFGGNPVVKLPRAISFNAQFGARNPKLCLFLDYLTAELNAGVNFLPRPKKVYGKYQSFISDIIAAGIQQALVNKALNSALTALIFIAVHHGLLHQRSLNRCQLNSKEYERK